MIPTMPHSITNHAVFVEMTSPANIIIMYITAAMRSFKKIVIDQLPQNHLSRINKQKNINDYERSQNMTDIEKKIQEDVPAAEALNDSALENVAGGFSFEGHKYDARDYKHCGITFVKNLNANDQFFYNGRPIKEKEANEIVDRFAQRSTR